MICKKCGGIVENNLSVCPNCGTGVEEPLKILLSTPEETDEAQQEQKEINEIRSEAAEAAQNSEIKEQNASIKLTFIGTVIVKIIKFVVSKDNIKTKIISASAALVFILLLSFLFSYNSASSKIVRTLEKNEFSAAAEIYNKKYNRDEQPGRKFVKRLEKYIDELQKDFNANSVPYSDAKEALNVIEDMRVDALKDIIKEANEYTDALNTSRQAYVEAKKYHSLGDYANAIISYKQVLSEDENYKDAVSALTEIIDLYRDQMLESAERLADVGDTLAAIDELRAALEILKNDKQLKNAMDDYIYSQYEAVRKATLNKAAAYVKDKDYANAIAVIKELLDDNVDDDTLNETYNNYLTEYETYVLSESGDLAAGDKIFEALDLLEEALAVMTGNEQLQAKKAAVETLMPTDLFSLIPSSSSKWESGTGSLKDPKGNVYKPRLSYMVAGDSEAVYKLNGEYRKLEGQIIPHRDMAAGIIGQVVVYADDKLVYSSPAIIRSTNQFGFSVDIEGADEIRIVVSGSEEERPVSLIFMDVVLFGT